MFPGRKTKTASLAEKYLTELQGERRPKDSPVLSERELAKHFSVSVLTAARILNLLVENDFLYRVPKCGTFIKHDPPVMPRIAYAGPLPDPKNRGQITNEAVSRLMEHFSELGIEPKMITYQTLRHPELAVPELENCNGLLIHHSHVDNVTLNALSKYPGRIMLTGNIYIDERLTCSQVIPDFTDPLTQFDRFRKFGSYAKILLVEADHENSRASTRYTVRILQSLGVGKDRMEVIPIKTCDNLIAYLKASRHFSACGRLPENTLIIAMSEYFAQGIREVYSADPQCPDILSIDNLEGYAKKPETPAWFTSIDCQFGELACRALDLLCSQLNDPGREQTILRVPGMLFIRESVKVSSCKTQDSRRKTQDESRPGGARGEVTLTSKKTRNSTYTKRTHAENMGRYEMNGNNMCSIPSIPSSGLPDDTRSNIKRHNTSRKQQKGTEHELDK